MSENKSYFIMIDKQEIQEMSMPDRGIEYEIKATPEQVDKLKALFASKNTESRKAIGYLSKPFDEWGTDEKRAQYDDYLIKIYQRIYELGTGETKRKISELGLFTE